MGARVYTLARELRTDAKALMELAASKGIALKSHMSTLNDKQERTLRLPTNCLEPHSGALRRHFTIPWSVSACYHRRGQDAFLLSPSAVLGALRPARRWKALSTWHPATTVPNAAICT